MKPLGCLIALLTGLQLASAASEDPANTEPPKSAPLSELHSVKMQYLSFRMSILNGEIQKLYAERNTLIAEICKETGIDNCQVTPDFKSAIPSVPVRPTNRPQPAPRSPQNETGAEAPSQQKKDPPQ